MFRASLLSAAVLFIVCSSASATLIVDQSNFPTITGSTGQIGGVSTSFILQEFTPTLNAVDFVRVGVKNFDNAIQTVQLDIYAVDSGTHATTGPSLGTTSANIAPLFDSISGGLIQFDLPSTVSLTPGNLYGFELNRPIQAMNFYYDAAAGYPGGQLFFQSPFPTRDLIFQEGADIIAGPPNPAVAPEPSSLALFALCTLMFRRGRKNPIA